MGALRNWRDYRSFQRLPPSAKSIVFYSESGQDWHHFAPVIDQLTSRFARSLCYVSSDPEDPGLSTDDPSVYAFCIGNGVTRTTFFQFLKTDVMVMTMIDLHNLQLKRSINPVHYVYIFHSLISTHMADFESSYDHYDTILCAGPHQLREIRRREDMQNLAPKNLVPHGHHRIEQLMEERNARPPHEPADPPHILLAPSWGENTILHTCGDRVVGVLLDSGLAVTLRPHWQSQESAPGVIRELVSKYGSHEHFRFESRMSDNDSLFASDVMVTDWSGAAMDYALGLEKPVVFIDLPPKSRNNSWQSLGIEPLEISIRPKIGRILGTHELERMPDTIRSLLAEPDAFSRQISRLRSECVYNLGHSASAAAETIVALADRSRTGAGPAS
ncbi:MAG: CDP-glycerol glycerophosphotransferase family protein [Gammaproteobacteria bacterium]|nr:MAG: CDP-glycerol glycerophosphotransferase family protein [Gammaproteobacteria bacterium]